MNAHELVGERIHIAMRRRGLSGADVARGTGMNQSVLSKKLRGRDRKFSLDELLVICAYLDLPVTDVLEGVPTRQA